MPVLQGVIGLQTIGVNLTIRAAAQNSRVVASFNSAVHAAEAPMKSLEQHTEATNRLAGMWAGLGIQAGAALLTMAGTAATAAESLEKLQTASKRIATNIGISSAALNTQIKGLKAQLFTTSEATEAVNKLNVAQAAYVDTARLATIANDLATSKNLKAVDVLNTLTDAIAKASAESLNQMDIGITNSLLFTKVAKAQGKTVASLDMAIRRQAVYNYILQKGATFQGAFADTADQASYTFRKLGVAAKSAYGSIGEGVLIVLKPFAQFATMVLDLFNSWPSTTKKFVGGAIVVVGGIALIGAAVKRLADTLKLLKSLAATTIQLRTAPVEQVDTILAAQELAKKKSKDISSAAHAEVVTRRDAADARRTAALARQAKLDQDKVDARARADARQTRLDQERADARAHIETLREERQAAWRAREARRLAREQAAATGGGTPPPAPAPAAGGGAPQRPSGTGGAPRAPSGAAGGAGGITLTGDTSINPTGTTNINAPSTGRPITTGPGGKPVGETPTGTEFQAKRMAFLTEAGLAGGEASTVLEKAAAEKDETRLRAQIVKMEDAYRNVFNSQIKETSQLWARVGDEDRVYVAELIAEAKRRKREMLDSLNKTLEYYLNIIKEGHPGPLVVNGVAVKPSGEVPETGTTFYPESPEGIRGAPPVVGLTEPHRGQQPLPPIGAAGGVAGKIPPQSIASALYAAANEWLLLWKEAEERFRLEREKITARVEEPTRGRVDAQALKERLATFGIKTEDISKSKLIFSLGHWASLDNPDKVKEILARLDSAVVDYMDGKILAAEQLLARTTDTEAIALIQRTSTALKRNKKSAQSSIKRAGERFITDMIELGGAGQTPMPRPDLSKSPSAADVRKESSDRAAAGKTVQVIPADTPAAQQPGWIAALVPSGATPEEAQLRFEDLIKRAQVEWEHQRDKKNLAHDLPEEEILGLAPVPPDLEAGGKTALVKQRREILRKNVDTVMEQAETQGRLADQHMVDVIGQLLGLGAVQPQTKEFKWAGSSTSASARAKKKAQEIAGLALKIRDEEAAREQRRKEEADRAEGIPPSITKTPYVRPDAVPMPPWEKLNLTKEEFAALGIPIKPAPTPEAKPGTTVTTTTTTTTTVTDAEVPAATIAAGAAAAAPPAPVVPPATPKPDAIQRALASVERFRAEKAAAEEARAKTVISAAELAKLDPEAIAAYQEQYAALTHEINKKAASITSALNRLRKAGGVEPMPGATTSTVKSPEEIEADRFAQQLATAQAASKAPFTRTVPATDVVSPARLQELMEHESKEFSASIKAEIASTPPRAAETPAEVTARHQASLKLFQEHQDAFLAARKAESEEIIGQASATAATTQTVKTATKAAPLAPALSAYDAALAEYQVAQEAFDDSVAQRAVALRLYNQARAKGAGGEALARLQTSLDSASKTVTHYEEQIEIKRAYLDKLRPTAIEGGEGTAGYTAQMMAGADASIKRVQTAYTKQAAAAIAQIEAKLIHNLEGAVPPDTGQSTPGSLNAWEVHVGAKFPAAPIGEPTAAQLAQFEATLKRILTPTRESTITENIQDRADKTYEELRALTEAQVKGYENFIVKMRERARLNPAMASELRDRIEAIQLLLDERVEALAQHAENQVAEQLRLTAKGTQPGAVTAGVRQALAPVDPTVTTAVEQHTTAVTANTAAVNANIVSAAALQRQFGIGYPEAARLAEAIKAGTTTVEQYAATVAQNTVVVNEDAEAAARWARAQQAYTRANKQQTTAVANSTAVVDANVVVQNQAAASTQAVTAAVTQQTAAVDANTAAVQNNAAAQANAPTGTPDYGAGLIGPAESLVGKAARERAEKVATYNWAPLPIPGQDVSTVTEAANEAVKLGDAVEQTGKKTLLTASAVRTLGQIATKVFPKLAGFLTGNWVTIAVVAAIAAIKFVVDQVKKKELADFKKTLGKTLAEQEAQFSLYTEQMAAADKARLENTSTFIGQFLKTKEQVQAEIDATGGLFKGTADIEEAREKLRSALKEEARKKDAWYMPRSEIKPEEYFVGIDKYVDNLTLKNIPDVYRALELGSKQLTSQIWADILNQLTLRAAQGASFGNEFAISLANAVQFIFTGKTWELKVAIIPEWQTPLFPANVGGMMGAEQNAIGQGQRKKLEIGQPKPLQLDAAGAIGHAITEASALSNKIVADAQGLYTYLDKQIEAATKQSDAFTESLKDIEDQLFHIQQAERGLDRELRPFEEALMRAEAAASLITIPLERQKRAIEKAQKAAQKQLDDIKKRHEEENSALEKAIELAQKKLEIDQERLKVIDWELFIENTKNKIRKQETSGYELQLKTQKMILSDSIEMQQQALDKMKEQLDEQKKKQDLEIKAAEKQIEAADAQMALIDEQIAAAQEKVTYAQEELELQKAMQIEQRIALENQRTALEDIQTMMQHEKQAIDDLIAGWTTLKEKMGEGVTESEKAAAANVEAVKVAEQLGIDLSQPMQIKISEAGVKFPDYVKAIKEEFVTAQEDLTADLNQWASVTTPYEIGVAMSKLGESGIPGLMIMTGMDKATGNATTMISDMINQPETGIISMFVTAGEAIAEALQKALDSVVIPQWLLDAAAAVNKAAAAAEYNEGDPTKRYATGFEGFVRKPTRMLVGENGAEYVSVQPATRHSVTGVRGSGSGRAQVVSNNVSNTTTIVNEGATINMNGSYPGNPSRRSVVSDLQLAASSYH